MTSLVQSQFFPQLAGLKVKAELRGNEFPVGVPVKTQVPHSCVVVQPENEKHNGAISSSFPSVRIFILWLLFSVATAKSDSVARVAGGTSYLVVTPAPPALHLPMKKMRAQGAATETKRGIRPSVVGLSVEILNGAGSDETILLAVDWAHETSIVDRG
jgi:hypothetical protein